MNNTNITIDTFTRDQLRYMATRLNIPRGRNKIDTFNNLIQSGAFSFIEKVDTLSVKAEPIAIEPSLPSVETFELFLKAAQKQQKTLGEPSWGHSLFCNYRNGDEKCNCGVADLQTALQRYNDEQSY